MAPAILAVEGLDPIYLCNGTKVLGQSAFSVTYLRHEYHFANARNMATFKKDPTRFAAQNGGACGRMGALSGKGNPARYVVDSGKLYFFASDSCRTTFLKSPETFTKPAPTKDPSPFESTSQAEKAWAKVLAKHNPGIRPQNIAWTNITPYMEKGNDKIWKSHRFVGKDFRLAMWEEWDAGRSFFLRDGNFFAEGRPGEFFDVHPDEKVELTEFLCSNLAGFVLGYAKPIEMTSDTITIKVGNRVITAKIEGDLISGISYIDHVGGPLTKVEIRYASFSRFGGVILPTESQRRMNGGPWEEAQKQLTYRVDADRPIVFSDIKAN